MATAWIHRSHASDILVRFQNATDAYNFLVTLAKKYGDELMDIATEPIYIPYEGYDIAFTPSMQFALQDPEFDALGWNTNIVVLNPEEAEGLGESGEPVGFIPGESEAPWYPERRSATELDEELEAYMYHKQLTELYHEALTYIDYFSPGEWWRIQETEDYLVESGQYEAAMNHWRNVINQAKESQ